MTQLDSPIPSSVSQVSLPVSAIPPFNVRRYYAMHFVGAAFPFAAGVMLYGWRAAIAIIVVMGTAALATGIWRRVGSRGRQLNLMHTLWMSLLLGLMLPAHLLTLQPQKGVDLWPLLPAAGIALLILLWVLGGLGAGRVHPVLATYLLLAIFFSDFLTPNWVLQRNRLVSGDLLHGTVPTSPAVAKDPWVTRPIVPNEDALWMEPASQSLSDYTSGEAAPDRSLVTVQSLLRDKMPPLEDLIAGTHPGPIGAGGAIAVTIGGLFLLYRGLIDIRIPMLIMLAMFLTMLVLPIPVVITDKPVYTWLPWRDASVGLGRAVTFVNYELMAGPALFMSCFLATSPSIRPMARGARWIYSILVGLLSALFQLYVDVSFGAYLALLIASLLTPSFDKWFRPRPLV